VRGLKEVLGRGLSLVAQPEREPQDVYFVITARGIGIWFAEG